MDDRNKSDVVTTTGIIHPTILLQGKLKAKWRKERLGIGITPFGRLSMRDRKTIISKAMEVFSGEIKTVTFYDGQYSIILPTTGLQSCRRMKK